MTLADLITQSVSYETAKELAIVLTPDQAATLGAIQAQYGNPHYIAAPIPLLDGRLMLCADLLTEIAPGGLYSGGFAHLPADIFPQVQILPMTDAIALIPQAEEEI